MLSAVLSSALGSPDISLQRVLLQATDKEVASKIDDFISKLKQLKEVHSPFTFVSMSRNADPFCWRSGLAS